MLQSLRPIAIPSPAVPARAPLVVRALVAWIGRRWQHACRHAEAPARRVPYY